jgi:uncharacterized FAD-dependent dehydrogenase
LTYFGSGVGSGAFVLTGQEARFDTDTTITLTAGFSAVLSGGFAHCDAANLTQSLFPFATAGVFRAAAVMYRSYTG